MRISLMLASIVVSGIAALAACQTIKDRLHDFVEDVDVAKQCRPRVGMPHEAGQGPRCAPCWAELLAMAQQRRRLG